MKRKPIVPIYLSYSRCPEACDHITDAINMGLPQTLMYVKDSHTVRAHRRESTRKLLPRHDLDRDEYPFACTAEGGSKADVRYISPHDNRAAGCVMGHQLKPLSDGQWFEIVILR